VPADPWQTGQMSDPPFTVEPQDLSAAPGDLVAVADRLSSLAETAELMGDEAGASRFRDAAAIMRLQAMDLLDD
jgi:hypothetical protein